MEYLDSNYYVEVKDHRYKIHPTENFIIRLRDEPKSFRTQNHVQNETQIRTNQKTVEHDGKFEVKNYPNNKLPIIQQPKFTSPNCPNCKQKSSLEFDKGYYCKNCEYIIIKQKNQIDKKSS